MEAQWKRSGCAVEAQCYNCCDLKQKKTGVPMTAPQNRPKILRTPHHLYLREFCVKLGRNRGNRPNFAPVAFLVGTTRVALRAAQRKTLRTIMRSLALLPQKIFALLRLYWRRSPFTYVSYFTIMYVSKTLLLLAVGAAVIN